MNAPALQPFTFSVPRLATPRLLLRELRMGDFDGYAENLADPVATTYLGGVSDRRNAWRTFAAGAGAWALKGAGWWAVELRETQETVGTVGAFIRETSPDLELGWIVYRRFWRQGLASEAAAAAQRHAFEAHAAARVIAHIARGNVASVRVSAHLGMRYLGEVDFYGERVGRYAIDRAPG